MKGIITLPPYFGDGEIEAVVEGVHQNTVTLRSLSGGRLGNHVAIGIKGKEFFKFLIDEKEIAEVNSVLHRFPNQSYFIFY